MSVTVESPLSLNFHRNFGAAALSRYNVALVFRWTPRNCGAKSSEWLQIEDANLHTVSHSSLLDSSRPACLPLLINSRKFTSRLLTANKVNNVWQLSRLNDPRETQLLDTTAQARGNDEDSFVCIRGKLSDPLDRAEFVRHRLVLISRASASRTFISANF